MKITEVRRSPVFTIEFTDDELTEIMKSFVGQDTRNWTSDMWKFHELLSTRNVPGSH